MFQPWQKLMSEAVGSTPNNPIKLTQYRVTLYPKQQYTRRVYPDHRILAIKRVVDLVEERVQ